MLVYVPPLSDTVCTLLIIKHRISTPLLVHRLFSPPIQVLLVHSDHLMRTMKHVKMAQALKWLQCWQLSSGSSRHHASRCQSLMNMEFPLQIHCKMRHTGMKPGQLWTKSWYTPSSPRISRWSKVYAFILHSTFSKSSCISIPPGLINPWNPGTPYQWQDDTLATPKDTGSIFGSQVYNHCPAVIWCWCSWAQYSSCKHHPHDYKWFT